MSKFTRAIAGSDFDIPITKKVETIDITKEMKELVQYLPNAEKIELWFFPILEMKDCHRVRIKILYKKEIAMEEPLNPCESPCYDCLQDKDLCVDCYLGDLYISPEIADPKENR